MEQDLAKALYPVQLFHVGRVIYDDSEQWMALVHDCTLPETPLAQTALPEDADSYKELNEQKRRVLEAIPVTQWFAPTFAQIDKAVFGKTKTLVHCRAGMSRSATLLAAYLIRRFGLSAEDSLNFLKKKRACVDSKFTEALKKYANCLGIRDC
ncbi:MAG: dual specificity protein phosphatase family protein [Verrucomicrobia bacterium]|nr:dual specificity protein phosphatase family protein [Verrucomicrobiota bacterium]MDE3047811.1 dual specificity protein phosphatase family protein [Verrucomicrobiota bacterium]